MFGAKATFFILVAVCCLHLKIDFMFFVCDKIAHPGNLAFARVLKKISRCKVIKNELYLAILVEKGKISLFLIIW